MPIRSRLLWKALWSMVAALLLWFPLFYWLTVPYLNKLAYQVEENASRNVLSGVVETVRQSAQDLDLWRTSTLRHHEQSLKSTLDIVVSHADQLESEVRAGRISKHAAKAKLINWLRHVRYGGEGYLWATDYQSVIVAHPEVRFNARDSSSLRDARGNLVGPPMVAKALADGAGYATYWWVRPGGQTQEEKLSYFRNFPAWEMVIGTGVYVGDIEAEVQQRKQAMVSTLRDYLHKVRLGGAGYVFVIDGAHNVIVHPDQRIEGQSMTNLKDPVSGEALAPKLIAAASSPEQSVTYFWNRPDDPENYHYQKVSWVYHLPEYDWYLGASLYVTDLGKTGSMLSKRLIIAFIIGLLLTAAVMMALISHLTTPILRLARLARRNAAEDWVLCPDTGRADEIGELSDAFNRMVGAQKMRISELRASEARFRGLLDQSLVGMFVIQDGMFCYVNQAFATMHGFTSPDEVVNKVSPGSLLAEDQRAEVEARMASQLAGVNDDSERVLKVLHHKGHFIEIAVSSRRCEYAGAAALIGVVLDVTAQREAERARESALRTAEQLSMLKSEFIANMSHELRTPLHGVIGLAHLGARSKDLESAHEYSAQILKSSRQLLALVESVLDFSRFADAPAKPDAIAFNPHELFADLEHLWGVQARMRGLEFMLSIAPLMPSTLQTDAACLRKVLDALLNNAVKFTAIGKVQLSADFDGHELKVAISDTGPGISVETQSQLFNPFAQLDGSATRLHGGMGLGLALAQRMLQSLGGRITLQSESGKGSIFTVNVPCDMIPEMPREISSAGAQPDA